MNLNEYENKMTLFYYKSTGKIKNYCLGVQDMNFFADNKIDYDLICDYLVVDYDNYVISNLNNFIIIDNKLKLSNSIISKYK